MPQRRACTFIYVSEQYLLSPLIQCFHSKRNIPISSTLSIHCLIVVTMSYQTKNPVRSFLQSKRPFLQQDFQQDFNSSVNWQKHWPSRLKTHSGMYVWSLCKLSHACSSIGFAYSQSRYWWAEISCKCSEVKIGLVCAVCGFTFYWVGPAVGLPFSRRARPF